LADGTTTTTDDAAAEEEAPRDERREALLAVFAEHLGDAVLASHIRPGQGLWVRIATEAWGTAAEVARDTAGLRFFDFLSAIDWMPSPFGRYEDATVDEEFPPPPPDPASIVAGYAGGSTRLQLLAGLARIGTDERVFLKSDVPDDDPVMPTWTHVYRGADWHERETWEMFGIRFEGHPGLRYLYLPTGFEGHPLRKDFPLLARVVKPWPGIVDVEPMPGEPDEGVSAEGEEASES
jgi:NADH-quinone oxidoreductase subunit C